MGDEIVVTVETPEEPIAEVVAEEVSVIEQAIELAEIIDDARQEGQQEAEAIVYSLEMVMMAIGELKGLIEYCLDELATLKAIEVAEIIVEETPAVEEAVTEEVVLEPEEVVEVHEPAPRIQKRKRNFI